MKPLLLSLLVALGPGTGAGALANAADDPSTGKTSELAGTWTWAWKESKGAPHTHVLEVEGTAAKLAARERFDEQPPVAVTKLALDGKKVRFTVVRGNHRAEYSGVLAKTDAINGTVTVTDEGQSHEFEWKAKRKPAVR